MRFTILVILFTSVYGISYNGFFPLKGSLSFSSGYDSNALRLSAVEKRESAWDPTILGKHKTFDSAYLRLSGSIYSLYRLKKRSNYIRFYVNGNYTDYLQLSDKQYYSGKISLLYQWRYHLRLETHLSRLQHYYLRDYIDRDISNRNHKNCFFTDEEYGIDFSVPLGRKLWVETSLLFLKRYYNPTFAEFDLDITSGGFEINLNPLKNISVSMKSQYGTASNITFNETARASNFDRSYSYFENSIPVTYSSPSDWISELGVRITSENRYYDAESYDDPLHSGRDHSDRKFDVWISKEFGRESELKLVVRDRKRTTNSEFEWVKDLKSFHQVQAWMIFSWRFIYDRY